MQTLIANVMQWVTIMYVLRLAGGATTFQHTFLLGWPTHCAEYIRDDKFAADLNISEVDDIWSLSALPKAARLLWSVKSYLLLEHLLALPECAFQVLQALPTVRHCIGAS